LRVHRTPFSVHPHPVALMRRHADIATHSPAERRRRYFASLLTDARSDALRSGLPIRSSRGGIVLAGHAAHIYNPIGGFGLNGGVHDARNLAESLRTRSR
jgi:2-polyprenyl-6-methoxyphenol hydroxylase-like FAD-dependent oxidoreductase